MTVQFGLDPTTEELKGRVRQFVEDMVIPLEGSDGDGDHGPSEALRSTLQDAALDAKIFAPTAPVGHGGLGLDHRAQAVILEEAGRSLLGPLALNCAAPDEGNILLLDKVATDEQRARYLDPLARGQARSCFAMTEPSPGAGADPESLNTTAARVPGGWRLTGRKWFITGADGAAFAIVMARTEKAATMFLVDLDARGFQIVRRLETLDSAFAGGHCEILLDDCFVPDSAVLGEPDEGFGYAQVRLGPARLTHCMRWLGAARRAHEAAVSYAAGRPMFGTHLADLGMAQAQLADNEIDIAASRSLIWRAAWSLDEGRPSREETSVAKVFVSEAAFRVVDRSMQLCGGSGTLDDGPISRIFREIRPFRIYDGPSEVHRWSIARRATRRSTAGILPGDWA